MQLSITFSSMTKLELIDDICEYWQARDSPFRLSVKKKEWQDPNGNQRWIRIKILWYDLSIIPLNMAVPND